MYKLVRDKIPEIIASRGELCETVILNDTEYSLALLFKLEEEAKEVLLSQSREELVEELADTFEVFYAILKAENISIQEVLKKRKQKKAEKGGFEKKIHMRIA